MSNLDNEFESLPSDAPGSPVLTSKLRYENDRTTVTLTASYQTIYSYSGSGKLIGVFGDFESNLTEVKVSVDSEVLFEAQLVDLMSNTGNKEFSIGNVFTDATGKKFVFAPAFPVVYSTQVLFEARMSTGKKKFGHLACLTKES